MQKWGKDRNGQQRYFCKNCQQTAIRKRRDLSLKRIEKVFQKRLVSPLNLKDYSHVAGINDRTLRRQYSFCWKEEITPPNYSVKDEILIIDGFVISSGFNRYRRAKGKGERKSCVVLIIRTKERIITWGFYDRENYASWFHLLSTLKGQPLAIVGDGQKEMLKAIRELFPRTLIQRCHFHLLSRNRQLLTLNPETQAAIDLTILVKRVPQIKTKTELNIWLQDYRIWKSNYDQFLKERTYVQIDPNYPYKSYRGGKLPWTYTHRRVRSAHYQLKKALPFLFQYLKHPQIPNTSNLLEGAINSPLSELLRRHRGLILSKQKILVANFLSNR